MNGIIGRLLVAQLFIGSFANKYATFGTDGGPAVTMMIPKVDAFKAGVEAFIASHTGTSFTLPHVEPMHLLMIAMFLEAAGSFLYILGSPFGAKLLMLFLVAVSPIMHDFWNNEPSTSEFELHMIMFLKNVALFGALLSYCSMHGALEKAKTVSNSKKTN
mmetsp:Transcript_13505/g.25815  ORF Transcript_13505/g.25815 Transcript_13505/m.25815 type:complete len:160 (-) Transcript_13505:305-784(-)|eukprot:CAMPEP_0114227522 /NCGR_PEP_ID=MMETSP0058-20121206/1837_1 /TAXON_ID=36894 /ORGANISM="Pyramimonas parkeae, CCMP726" /LENGTH=159 /DNA_ID=CAMNT_0001338373 /DNA_START=55 /DNA_END=534 /DNA_ORIENTATION=-